MRLGISNFYGAEGEEGGIYYPNQIGVIDQVEITCI